MGFALKKSKTHPPVKKTFLNGYHPPELESEPHSLDLDVALSSFFSGEGFGALEEAGACEAFSAAGALDAEAGAGEAFSAAGAGVADGAAEPAAGAGEADDPAGLTVLSDDGAGEEADDVPLSPGDCHEEVAGAVFS